MLMAQRVPAIWTGPASEVGWGYGYDKWFIGAPILFEEGRHRDPTGAPSLLDKRLLGPEILGRVFLNRLHVDDQWHFHGQRIRVDGHSRHSRSVPSSLAPASVCPSGARATDHTRSVWPARGRPSGHGRVGLNTSHARIVRR